MKQIERQRHLYEVVVDHPYRMRRDLQMHPMLFLVPGVLADDLDDVLANELRFIAS